MGLFALKRQKNVIRPASVVMTGLKKSWQIGLMKCGGNSVVFLKTAFALALTGWGCGGSIDVESTREDQAKNGIQPDLDGSGDVRNLDSKDAKVPDPEHERESTAACTPDLVKAG